MIVNKEGSLPTMKHQTIRTQINNRFSTQHVTVYSKPEMKQILADVELGGGSWDLGPDGYDPKTKSTRVASSFEVTSKDGNISLLYWMEV